MDAQLRRGILDVCVLSVLRRGESYGYQIIQDLQGIIVISESTLYPILKRLLSSRFVTVRNVEHGGRLRKYYRITSLGIQRINEFIIDSEEMLVVHRFIKKETM